MHVFYAGPGNGILMDLFGLNDRHLHTTGFTGQTKKSCGCPKKIVQFTSLDINIVLKKASVQLAMALESPWPDPLFDGKVYKSEMVAWVEAISACICSVISSSFMYASRDRLFDIILPTIC